MFPTLCTPALSEVISCSRRAVRLWLIFLLAALSCSSLQAGPLFLRVSLAEPKERPWRVQIICQGPGGKTKSWHVGRTSAETPQAAELAVAGQPTGWLDVSAGLTQEGATIRFLFEVPGAPVTEGVQARIDVATAADESAILRTIAEHDPGRVVAIRVPGEPAKAKEKLLSIREDTQRRLDQVKSWKLPEGPLPHRLWCMTGFRSSGEFYTDPAIAEMDMEIIQRLGMNGYWEQGGGQPRGLREMAHAHGLDRSTVYWRNVESLPREKELDGASRLDWGKLERLFDQAYQQNSKAKRDRHPTGTPEILVDLMDEPAGNQFAGPEYAEQFREYAHQQGLTPQELGQADWASVSPRLLNWTQYFAERDKLNPDDLPAHRLFYWSSKFWTHSTARLYALATQKVERYAPATGTRVNFGPPWVYDYGTLPRGIDAFEFGRLRGVSLGFNEDWIGSGSPRVPLELNTLLIDWSRAAARPARPLLGSYITRDADRATVKLRTFACLAREAKIFDFYYYGPAYTFFDHWSDNAGMVQGVGELTRDLGAVDDVLWEGKAPPAEVALLYSQSWPVWKRDDTEQCEQMMTYLALLHAGIPVDIVSDTEVADGRFAARQYKCLYVIHESIPARAATEIERWVRTGGRLWAGGWAGARDEYNLPATSWDTMLGMKGRTWKPTGDLSRLGKPIKPDDWLRPIIGREVAGESVPSSDHLPLDLPGHEPKAWSRSYGTGSVRVVPWTAGKEYMDGAVSKEGSLAKATLFPDDHRRKIIVDFAVESGSQPAAATSCNQVLAWPLWTQQKGVILLANYTGEPTGEIRVQFRTPLPITKARSLRLGDLPIEKTGTGQAAVTLSRADVTDIISVE